MLFLGPYESRSILPIILTEFLISGDEIVTYKLKRKVIHGMRGGHINIRFDTSFQDEKFESYYCVLFSNSPMDKLHVVEHSIPFFLPVRELEKAHLATSPKEFIDYIGDVLQAYVSRREQVNFLVDDQAFWFSCFCGD